LMCSISGSFAAASVGISGTPSVGAAHPSQFGSKLQPVGYMVGKADAPQC
jgi:hypothetical protein